MAQIDNNLGVESLVHLHMDHLSTPRLATDTNGVIVWHWESEAFGNTVADSDPDGDLNLTIINLRFPGQYLDAESSLHYNWNRYYDPAKDRFISSDSLGIDAGINTYLYAFANALRIYDFNGLASVYQHGNSYTDVPKSTASSTGCKKPVTSGEYVVAWIPCDEPDAEKPGKTCPSGYTSPTNKWNPNNNYDGPHKFPLPMPEYEEHEEQDWDEYWENVNKGNNQKREECLDDLGKLPQTPQSLAKKLGPAALQALFQGIYVSGCYMQYPEYEY